MPCIACSSLPFVVGSACGFGICVFYLCLWKILCVEIRARMFRFSYVPTVILIVANLVIIDGCDLVWITYSLWKESFSVGPWAIGLSLCLACLAALSR